MKFKNIDMKEFMKLVGILFLVIFIVSIIFLNYLIDHNILMYGMVIQDSMSIFGFMISKSWWVVIISFIVTIICTVLGLLFGYFLNKVIDLVFKFFKDYDEK